jgi:hypothetical protein
VLEKPGLGLSDGTHTQIKQRADTTGVAVRSWIVATIERENFLRARCTSVAARSGPDAGHPAGSASRRGTIR